jgi:hypothetical protein
MNPGIAHLTGDETSGFSVSQGFRELVSFELFSVLALVALNHEWSIAVLSLDGHDSNIRITTSEVSMQ